MAVTEHWIEVAGRKLSPKFCCELGVRAWFGVLRRQPSGAQHFDSGVSSALGTTGGAWKPDGGYPSGIPHPRMLRHHTAPRRLGAIHSYTTAH
jgi:hypothetical protein